MCRYSMWLRCFLLELYQFLSDALIDYYQSHCPSVLIQTSINTYKLPFGIKRNLLVNCIYGVDKDFNAVEACKFGLLLKLLEDEDVNTLSSFHPILPNLDENIFTETVCFLQRMFHQNW